MKYAILLYNDPAAAPEFGTPEMDAEMAEWFKFTSDLQEAGVHMGGEALTPTQTATTVRIRDGKTITTDGPFAETKETLGGFYLIDVENLDEAIKWCEKVPLVGYGSVEVRPIMDFN